MPNNSPNKIGNLPNGEWWIVKLTPAEQAYWRDRNPLKGYRAPVLADKAATITAVIEHIKLLIQHRIDRGERYFTEMSNHVDLLELRQDILAHFRQQGIDLSIRRGGYIFVFGDLNMGAATHAA
jgi:hypothetical protein